MSRAARNAGGCHIGHALAGVGLMLALIAPVQATRTMTSILTNAQGTVVAKMDAAGNVTYTAAYRPYGKQQTGTPQAEPGYTGHVNDPDTGLVYMQARYYDPDIGRFLSVDPDPISSGNVFNFNSYDYTDNNPVLNTDPTGTHTASEGDDVCMGNEECIVGGGGGGGGGGGVAVLTTLPTPGDRTSVEVDEGKVNFSKLKNNYPGHLAYPTNPIAPNSIWSLIGGYIERNAWSSARDSEGNLLPNNTCAIRMSYALNHSGMIIPQLSHRTVSGADRRQYFMRVRDLQSYLTKVLGHPEVLRGGSFNGPSGESGIISFNIPFSNAAGHFSLWDGSRLIDANTEPYRTFPKPTSIYFWRIK